jgi:hypothetical protein
MRYSGWLRRNIHLIVLVMLLIILVAAVFTRDDDDDDDAYPTTPVATVGAGYSAPDSGY